MFLLGKSHGQRSLAGYSQRGRKESNVTERLSTAHGTAIEFLKVKFRLELSFLNYKTRATLPPHLGNNKAMTYIMCVLIHVRVFVTPWTIVRRAPLSMGFPKKECQIGMLFPLQRILLTQGSNLCLLRWQAGSLPPSHLGSPCVIKTQNSEPQCFRGFAV